MWIQIKTPEPVLIYKFALRGLNTNTNTDRIFSWRLEANNNGIIGYTILYSTANTYIGNTTQFFNIVNTAIPAASFYKLVVVDSEGTQPGLSYFQLFTLDHVIHL